MGIAVCCIKKESVSQPNAFKDKHQLPGSQEPLPDILRGSFQLRSSLLGRPVIIISIWVRMVEVLNWEWWPILKMILWDWPRLLGCQWLSSSRWWWGLGQSQLCRGRCHAPANQSIEIHELVKPHTSNHIYIIYICHLRSASQGVSVLDPVAESVALCNLAWVSLRVE